MVWYSWKPIKAALQFALAAAVTCGVVSPAFAEGEAPTVACTVPLLGSEFLPPDGDATGTGQFELLEDGLGALSLNITFTGVADISGVGIYSTGETSSTEIINIAGAGAVSPVTYSFTPQDFEEIFTTLSTGNRVLIAVAGATDTIAASFGPCIGRPDGFADFCNLTLTGGGINPPSVTAATGSAEILSNNTTGEAFVKVDFDGIVSHTGIAFYSLTEAGLLDTKIVQVTDADAPSGSTKTLDSIEASAVTAATLANGVALVIEAGSDQIGGNLSQCFPAEGEGVTEGIVEGEGAAPALGYFRFVHGATSFGNLDLCVNGEASSGESVAFGTISDYVPLPVDSYTFNVYAEGDGCGGTALASRTEFLAEDAYVTIYIYDSPGKGGATIAINATVDDNTPATGFAKLRAVNLSTDTPTVDIAEDSDALGALPVIDNVTYGGTSDYVELAPQVFTPEVRSPDNDLVIFTAPAPLSLGDGGVYTIFITGLAAGSPDLGAATKSDVEGLPVEGEGTVDGEGEGVVEGEGEGVVEGEGEGVVEGEGEGVVEGEGEGVVEGEGEGSGDEPVDFCAVQDEIAGIVSDPILGPVLTDLLGEDIGLLELLGCDVADLNGALPVLPPEGEEQSIVDQLPDPNGLLDGPFELAVLAELINNPGAYSGLLAEGGVDAAAVGAAFDANLTIALGSLAGQPPSALVPLFELLLGDSLPVCGEGEGSVEGECFTEEEKDEIILRAAELVPNIGVLLSGYITLGDDNSIAVATLVLKLINDATDCILGLGGVVDCVSGEYDPNVYTRLDGILSADGDADGDGCTQRGEYNGLGANPEPAAYLAAVLNPAAAECPVPVDFCAVQNDIAGIVTDPILGPVLTDLLGEDIGLLELLSCDAADLNGPLPVLPPEGEEQSIVDQLPDPNGILDGPFELAVLAELINNPGPYAGLSAGGGVDAAAVGPAFEANLAIALGSLAGQPPSALVPLFELLLADSLPVCGEGEGSVEGECFTTEEKDEIILRAAELVPNIGVLLSGYITLGDDNSIAVATLVLKLINDSTDCILGLGGVVDCVSGVYDPNVYTRLDAILSKGGDADGDGCTQGQEYAALNAGKGALTTEAYVAAVLDANNTPANCDAVEGEVEGETVFHNGDTDQDGKIGLAELLRLIQLFNAGGYGCSLESTEDGYEPGAGDVAVGVGACVAHDLDFDSSGGAISLSELLRGIQFFNLQLVLVPGIGEDGWNFAG